MPAKRFLFGHSRPPEPPLADDRFRATKVSNLPKNEHWFCIGRPPEALVNFGAGLGFFYDFLHVLRVEFRAFQRRDAQHDFFRRLHI
jgi:hypothetical protein